MRNSRVVFLKGPRVIMRPLDKGRDLCLCQRWINDPDTRHRLATSWPKTLQDEIAWFDKSTGSQDHLVLVIEVDGQAIGTMGASINWKDRRANTGALIGESSCRGKGYGKEAKMLFLSFLFLQLNLEKVCSASFEDNTASLRYNAACGYHEEARLRRHIFRDGVYHDLVLTAVFREDWLPLWQKFVRF